MTYASKNMPVNFTYCLYTRAKREARTALQAKRWNLAVPKLNHFSKDILTRLSYSGAATRWFSECIELLRLVGFFWFFDFVQLCSLQHSFLEMYAPIQDIVDASLWASAARVVLISIRMPSWFFLSYFDLLYQGYTGCPIIQPFCVCQAIKLCTTLGTWCRVWSRSLHTLSDYYSRIHWYVISWFFWISHTSVAGDQSSFTFFNTGFRLSPWLDLLTNIKT